MRWACALALVGLVPLVGPAHPAIRPEWRVVSAYDVAVIGPSIATKNVAVFDSAMEDNGFCALNNFRQFSFGKLPRSWQVGVKSISGSDIPHPALKGGVIYRNWADDRGINQLHLLSEPNIQRWGLASVRILNVEIGQAVNVLSDSFRGIQVRPQLPFGRIFGASNEIASGKVQSISREEQGRRERGDDRVGDLEPVPKERRPELGSLLSAIFCLGLAFPVGAAGQDAWHAGRRFLGSLGLGFGFLLGPYGIIGLLLGLDPWSLWRLL